MRVLAATQGVYFCIKRLIALCQLFSLNVDFPTLGIGIGPYRSGDGVTLIFFVAVITAGGFGHVGKKYMSTKGVDGTARDVSALYSIGCKPSDPGAPIISVAKIGVGKSTVHYSNTVETVGILLSDNGPLSAHLDATLTGRVRFAGVGIYIISQSIAYHCYGPVLSL